MIKLGRKKKAGKTRSEVRIINKKHFGEEPTWVSGKTVTWDEKARALNWYCYMCDKTDAREFLTEWATEHLPDQVPILEQISDRSIPRTAAWLARMDTRGASIGKDSIAFIKESINERARYAGISDDEEEGEVVEETKGPTKLFFRVDKFIGDVETVIDRADWTFNAYDALKGNTMPIGMVSKIKTYYEPLLEEINLAVSGTDADIKEGYRNHPKAELKAKAEWLTNLIADCDRYSQNEKKLKAPRKPKAQSVEKKMKHFLYKREDLELKIASQDPSLIPGCSEVWTYDTKYKTLTVLRAPPDSEGLDVKRTTITGYDPATSMSKSVGRKAAHYTELVRTNSKSALSKLMDTISTKPYNSIKDRCNENIVILKVVRK